MQRALALILVVVTGHDAAAQISTNPYAKFVDVRAFCAALADANSQALGLAEKQIDVIKREIAVIAALQAKRGKVAAEAVEARARVAVQRRDVDELKTRLSHLSPAMIEERRMVGADLMAHLEVLDRFRQTEAVLEIELAGIEAEIAAKESDLRRCIADRRDRLR